MRRTLCGLLGVLSVFCIVSCGEFAIPESLTIQGKPGVHLPLGSPFGASGQSINDYIGRDKMQEMIGGNKQDNKVVLYDYQGNGTDNSIQTYLVQYEIAKLNLNLQEHIDDPTNGITVPPLIIPALPSIPGYSTEPSDPLLEISLGAIAQWMKNVHLDGAGITIRGGADLQNTLELKIPQLGIAGYSKGTPDGEDLVFTGGSYILFEQQSPNGPVVKTEITKIQIYAKLVGPPAGGTYETHLDFNWTKADLYPGTSGVFTGTYEVNFSELTGYLGNVKLKEVPGYVFISGLPDGAKGTMTLTGDENLVHEAPIKSASLVDSELKFNEDSTATGTIPSSSIDHTIDLSGLFNADTGTLQYGINVKSVPIYPSQKNSMITAELLIQIPLEFMVIEGDTITIEKTSYKELKLKPLQGLPDSGSGDLFGRSGKDDDLLQGVDEVRIGYYNYKNDILDGLSLFTGKITSGTWDGKMWEFNRDGPPVGTIIDFKQDEVNYPFNPRFKILVKDGVSLKIGRLAGGAKLDFSLVVDAKAAIDQTITF